MSTSYAYEQYFGLEEHPFSITPDPRFVYLSDSHRAALEHLEFGAAGGVDGFVLLTGDVGAGKTTICRTFLGGLPPKTEVALILNPVLTLNEFLQTICDELNLVIEGNRESNKNLIDQLNRFLLQVYAVGQKTILIIDEAQNLSQELLEQIRLLTNLETDTDKLLQIFLIGQPELRDMLKRPEMLQVAQRITSRYHLGPLNRADIRNYISRRLEVAGARGIDFTKAGIRGVFDFSKGVPRLINVLCDKALISAYESSTHKVDGKIIRDAVRRMRGNDESDSTAGGFTKVLAVFGFTALLAIVLLGAGYFMNVANLQPWISSQLTAIQGIENASRPETDDDKPQIPIENVRGLAETEVAALVNQAASEQIVTSSAPLPTPVEVEQLVDAEQTVEAEQIPGQPARVQRDGFDVGTTDHEPSEFGRGDTPEPSTPETRATPTTDTSSIAAARKERSAEQTPPDTRSLATVPPDHSLADYTRRYAERKLLSMWGITDPQPAGLDFCQSAARHELTCLKEASGLPGLYLYDRPAILYLSIDEVSSYAVVMNANSENVVLDVLDREHIIPADALRDVWDDSFLLLWRKSSVVGGHIVEGATGQSVVWLRRAIDQIDGSNTSGDVYDERLVARVKQFQSKVGLTPDGIVGPRTIILLQNKLAATGT